MLADFFRNKRVFITGHTGFKGSWLCLWLHGLGAEITGFALEPPTSPSLFVDGDIAGLITSVHGDVRDLSSFTAAMQEARPEIVIHMAAQPLVRDSYRLPVETYEINAMGTVNLFEAVRAVGTVRSLINITTDKVYENREWVWGYRENEPLGGYDPYSSSKACSELITSAYRNSFFHPDDYHNHGVAIASARAGNVIGGGDWARDRLVPDCLRALLGDEALVLRNPGAIRPWQHVLEPLAGYLLLARKLYQHGPEFGGAWNFGPPPADAKDVGWIAKALIEMWGEEGRMQIDDTPQPHEAGVLKLDCAKANDILGWSPVWSLRQALAMIVDWHKAYQDKVDMRRVCLEQIETYGDDARL